MIKLIFNLLFFITLVSLNSCYVSKTLEREVKVFLDKNIFIEISNTGNSSFSNNYTQDEYKNAFIDGLMAEFNSSKIVVTDLNPEFNISIEKISLRESTKIETVNDSDSPQNGNTYELSVIDVDSKGFCYNISKNTKSEWWANKNQEEKLTNNRSAGEVIAGDNKDKTEYREKEFLDNEALDLVEKCGRRSGARIINDIVKSIAP